MKTLLRICAVALASTLLVPPESSAAIVPGGFGAEAVDICAGGPSVAECQDADWLNNAWCGRVERQRLLDDPSSATCADACADLEPTREQCEDDAWMSSACGQLEAPRWLVYREAEIAGDVSGQHLDALRGDSQCGTATEGASPVESLEEVVLPENVADDDGVRVVSKGHYGREGQRFVGGTTHYQGHVSREWTRASSDAPGSEGGGWFSPALADALARMAWEDNGIAVDSCREYVYERYYDYSRFEDAIMGLGDDYRSIFRVAYDEGTVRRLGGRRRGDQPDLRVVPESAIGTRGIAGEPQTARDGALLEPQITFPGEAQPKNGLYMVGVLDADDRADARATYDAAVAIGQQARFQGSCGSALAGPVFCDDTLWQDLVDGAAVTHVESWAWHKQMSDDLQAAGYLDEHLAMGEQRVDDFEQLLYQRARAVGDIITWWSAKQAEIEAELPDEVADALFDPSVQMQLMAGDPISAQLAGQRAARLARADLGTMGINQPPAPMQRGVSYALPPSPSYTAYQSAAPHPTHALGTPVSVGSPAYLEALQNRLYRIDARIEQALLDARAAGCLEADVITPCDWSPRRFAQRVLALYSTEREDDYTYCVDNTPEGFGRLDGHDLGVPQNGLRPYPGIELDGAARTCLLAADGALLAGDADTTGQANCADCNRWSASTTAVEQYFRCFESHKQLILKVVVDALGQDAITPDGKLKLQGSTGESTMLGDENFNITASYGFGWAIGEFSTYADADDPDRCDLRPEAYAHFDVDATALFFSQSLVHAAAHTRLYDAAKDAGEADRLQLPAGVDPNRLEVELLGIEVVGADLDLDWSDGFNVMRDEWSEGGTLVSAGATFTIGFVPVTIAGGVAGRIGVDYTVDFEVPFAAQATCDLFALTGKVSPYAAVEGFASATVNAVVAEAGVKVYLTLLRIDLPFDVSLTLGINAHNELALRLSSSLDLVVSFLSGRVAAYLRVLWEEWEATLFSWNGPRFTKSLMDHGIDMPIASLEAAYGALETLRDQL